MYWVGGWWRKGGRWPGGRGCPVDLQTGAASVVPPLYHLLDVDASASSIHSTFAQNFVFLNPVAFSCLDDKGVAASDFFKRQEVEVGQVMARQVEVLPHPSVPVMV